MTETLTSGLRVEEILADYFVKKDEKVKNKVSDDEEKSNKDSNRHKHKHKKKSKKKHKHKSADDESDSKSSHKHHKHSKKRTSHKHHKSTHKSKREDSSDKKQQNDSSKTDPKECKNADFVKKPSDSSAPKTDTEAHKTNEPKIHQINSTDVKDSKNAKESDSVKSVSNGFKSVAESSWTPLSEIKVNQMKPPVSTLPKIDVMLPSDGEVIELKMKDPLWTPLKELKVEHSKPNISVLDKITLPDFKSDEPGKVEPPEELGLTISNSSNEPTKIDFVRPELPVPDSTLEVTSNVADDLEEGELVDNPKEGATKDASGETDSKKKKTHKHKKRKKPSATPSPDRKRARSSNLHKSAHRTQSGVKKVIRDSHRATRVKKSGNLSKKPLSSSRYSSRRLQPIERTIDNTRRRSRSPVRRVRDLRERIDKKQLLEIARRNVLEMIEAGTLPQGVPVANLQPQQLASIKAGGKSVQELTDFCKALAEKHKAYSSSGSDDDRRPPPASDDEDAPFIHHPFKSKEAQPMIRMNIRNAIQLPIRTTAEKTADSVKLRQQFPVSSGNQHRTKELEWVPVEKTEKKPSSPATKKQAPKAIEAPPADPVVVPPPAPVTVTPVAPPVDPADSVFIRPSSPTVDIGTIMSDRLNAMRKLQENPHDMQALSKMYHAQQLMQNWAESKMQPGQFGHSVTNRLLTPEELNGPYPVWARKDQLTSATPVQDGIGMHLLKKMGWNPGEGLGKNKEGSLVPLMLDVKTDKKGLVSNTEAHKSARPVVAKVTHDLSGKHPVSALMELCSKRKWGSPDYTLLDETGPDHRKNFLFKVRVKGVDYQPSVSSASKKQAKALAATVCLQAIGLIPRDLSNPL